MTGHPDAGTVQKANRPEFTAIWLRVHTIVLRP